MAAKDRDIKVSVIVPVYNSQEYLRQCLNSIVGQTLKDIEIIIVDDGSTDESPKILAEYAERDDRITVLHQQNLYAGAARNRGMARAQGEYLVFWDSDDFFELNALQVMYDAAKRDDADICVCGANRYYEKLDLLVYEPYYLRKSRIPKKMPFNADTNPDYIFNFTCAAPWNKLFKRSFIEKKDLKFGITRTANDFYFVVTALALADSITVVFEPLVTYRRNREGGLTNTTHEAAESPVKEWVRTARDLCIYSVERFKSDSYANWAFSNITDLLRKQKSFDNFSRIITYLRDGALNELGLYEDYELREEWPNELLRSIWNESAEDVAMRLVARSYDLQLERVAKLRAAQDEAREARRELKQHQKENRGFFSRLKHRLSS